MTEYTLHRSSRRKRSVALKVETDGSLHVMAPMRTNLKWIEAFITARQRWIQKRREEIQTVNQVKQTRLAHGAEVFFLGEKHRIKLYEESANDSDTSATILLTFLSEEPSPEEIGLALRLWYKKQARGYFEEHTSHWAEKMALDPKRVMVASPKQQWGSCSSDNVIRLNWRLMLMPKEVVDYVIVHELAHITHKNHSVRFWNLVGKYVPSYKLQRGVLRQWEKRYPSSF